MSTLSAYGIMGPDDADAIIKAALEKNKPLAPVQPEPTEGIWSGYVKPTIETGLNVLSLPGRGIARGVEYGRDLATEALASAYGADPAVTEQVIAELAKQQRPTSGLLDYAAPAIRQAGAVGMGLAEGDIGKYLDARNLSGVAGDTPEERARFQASQLSLGGPSTAMAYAEPVAEQALPLALGLASASAAAQAPTALSALGAYAVDPMMALLGGAGSLSRAGQVLKAGRAAEVAGGLIPTAEGAKALEWAKNLQAAEGPLGQALLETPGLARAASRGLGAAFVPGMALGAVDEAQRARDIYNQEGLSPEAVSALAGAATSGIFAGMGGLHALRGENFRLPVVAEKPVELRPEDVLATAEPVVEPPVVPETALARALPPVPPVLEPSPIPIPKVAPEPEGGGRLAVETGKGVQQEVLPQAELGQEQKRSAMTARKSKGNVIVAPDGKRWTSDGGDNLVAEDGTTLPAVSREAYDVIDNGQLELAPGNALPDIQGTRLKRAPTPKMEATPPTYAVAEPEPATPYEPPRMARGEGGYVAPKMAPRTTWGDVDLLQGMTPEEISRADAPPPVSDGLLREMELALADQIAKGENYGRGSGIYANSFTRSGKLRGGGEARQSVPPKELVRLLRKGTPGEDIHEQAMALLRPFTEERVNDAWSNAKRRSLEDPEALAERESIQGIGIEGEPTFNPDEFAPEEPKTSFLPAELATTPEQSLRDIEDTKALLARPSVQKPTQPGDFVTVDLPDGTKINGKVRDVVGKEAWIFVNGPRQAKLHDEGGSLTVPLSSVRPQEELTTPPPLPEFLKRTRAKLADNEKPVAEEMERRVTGRPRTEEALRLLRSPEVGLGNIITSAEMVDGKLQLRLRGMGGDEGASIAISPDSSFEILGPGASAYAQPGGGVEGARAESLMRTIGPRSYGVEFSGALPLTSSAANHEFAHVFLRALGMTDKTIIKRLRHYEDQAQLTWEKNRVELMKRKAEDPGKYRDLNEEDHSRALEEQLVRDWAAGKFDEKTGRFKVPEASRDLIGRMQAFWRRIMELFFPAHEHLVRQMGKMKEKGLFREQSPLRAYADQLTEQMWGGESPRLAVKTTPRELPPEVHAWARDEVYRPLVERAKEFARKELSGEGGSEFTEDEVAAMFPKERLSPEELKSRTRWGNKGLHDAKRAFETLDGWKRDYSKGNPERGIGDPPKSGTGIQPIKLTSKNGKGSQNLRIVWKNGKMTGGVEWFDFEDGQPLEIAYIVGGRTLMGSPTSANELYRIAEAEGVHRSDIVTFWGGLKQWRDENGLGGKLESGERHPEPSQGAEGIRPGIDGQGGREQRPGSPELSGIGRALGGTSKALQGRESSPIRGAYDEGQALVEGITPRTSSELRAEADSLSKEYSTAIADRGRGKITAEQLKAVSDRLSQAESAYSEAKGRESEAQYKEESAARHTKWAAEEKARPKTEVAQPSPEVMEKWGTAYAKLREGTAPLRTKRTVSPEDALAKGVKPRLSVEKKRGFTMPALNISASVPSDNLLMRRNADPQERAYWERKLKRLRSQGARIVRYDFGSDGKEIQTIDTGEVPEKPRLSVEPRKESMREPGPHPLVEKRVQEWYDIAKDLLEETTDPKEKAKIAAALDLNRNHPHSWEAVEKEASPKLRSRDLEQWHRRMTRGPLNDVESAAVANGLQGLREKQSKINDEITKARETGQEGRIAELNIEKLKVDGDLFGFDRAYLQDGTGVARALAIRARLAKAGIVPDADLKRIFREFPNITDDKAQLLASYMRDRTKAHLIPDLLRDLTNPTLKDQILEAWKSGLVSALPTQGSNIASTGLEQIVRLAETGISAGLRKATGRGANLHEVSAEWQGMKGALGPAWSNLWSNVKDAVSLKPEKVDLARPLEHQTRAIPGKAGRAVRIPFRFLDAADNFFFQIAEQAELNKGAYRMAYDRVKGGDAAEVRAEYGRILQSLAEDKPEFQELRVKAVAEARKRIFRAKPDDLAGAIVKLRDAIPFGIGHVVLPFVGTPYNILKVFLSRTPTPFNADLRALKKWYQEEGRAADKEGRPMKPMPIEHYDSIARVLMGTITAGTIIMAAKMGLVTGSGPTDRKKRNLKQETGWKPYSIVIPADVSPTGKAEYIPFSRFEPIASIMGMAADVSEKDEPGTDIADKIVGSITFNLTNKTFLKGMTDVSNLISDPKQFGGQYIRGLAGSIVPNALRKGAQVFDPTIRELRPESEGLAGVGESLGRAVLSGIPGLSKTLPERHTATGRPVERENTALGFVSPVLPSSEKKDREVEKLLLKADYIPGEPRRFKEVKGEKIRLTEEEYQSLLDSRLVATNYIAKNLVGNQRFEDLPNTGGHGSKAYILERVYNKALNNAWDKIVQKDAQSLRDRIKEQRDRSVAKSLAGQSATR